VNNGISTSSNETSYQVTGLYPFTVYSFRVLAVNAMGRSKASKESYYMVTLREGECNRSYVRPFLEYEFKYCAVGGRMDFFYCREEKLRVAFHPNECTLA
jgi:hypothetical protein